MSNTTRRILAIDPGTRHMGVAVLDGSDLIYYGVRDFKKKRPADELVKATRQSLLRLIQDYRPHILAYEKIFYTQEKNSALLKVQEGEIKRVGRAEGLQVFGYGPSTVRKLLCGDGRATKRDVADLLAQRYLELAPYRTRNGHVKEQYWLNMFDALAVAVVCAESLERGNRSRGDRRNSKLLSP